MLHFQLNERIDFESRQSELILCAQMIIVPKVLCGQNVKDDKMNVKSRTLQEPTG